MLEKTLPQISPDLQGLLEALFLTSQSESHNNFFSQSSKGDFYPDLKQGTCGAQVKINPSTVESHMEEVAQRLGLTSVSIDGTALREAVFVEDSTALPPEV